MWIISLLTKREVKMDGWISAKFFAFLLTETSDEVEVNKNAKKKEPIYSHLDQTSLFNRGFIYGQKENFFLRYQRWAYLARLGSQSECKIHFILAAWVANQNAGFTLSCPLGQPIRTQDSLYLASSGSQSEPRIHFILPARGFNHITIMSVIDHP